MRIVVNLQGLLKMSLLQRLRYIVEVWQPPRPIIFHIFNILIRIGRHSKQAAYEVLLCVGVCGWVGVYGCVCVWVCEGVCMRVCMRVCVHEWYVCVKLVESDQMDGA